MTLLCWGRPLMSSFINEMKLVWIKEKFSVIILLFVDKKMPMATLFTAKKCKWLFCLAIPRVLDSTLLRMLYVLQFHNESRLNQRKMKGKMDNTINPQKILCSQEVLLLCVFLVVGLEQLKNDKNQTFLHVLGFNSPLFVRSHLLTRLRAISTCRCWYVF